MRLLNSNCHRFLYSKNKYLNEFILKDPSGYFFANKVYILKIEPFLTDEMNKRECFTHFRNAMKNHIWEKIKYVAPKSRKSDFFTETNSILATLQIMFSNSNDDSHFVFVSCYVMFDQQRLL